MSATGVLRWIWPTRSATAGPVIGSSVIGPSGVAAAHDAADAVPFWRTLAVWSKPQRRVLMTSAAFAAVVGLMSALQPLCVKWIVDNGLLRKQGDTLASPDTRFKWVTLFVGLYVLISAVRVACSLLGQRLSIRALEDFISGLRCRFFEHVQHLGLSFHDRTPSGELLNSVMGSPMGSLKSFLHQAAQEMPLQLAAWTMATVALATLNLPLTVVTLVVVGAVVLLNRRSQREIRKHSTSYLQAESDVSSYAADTLRGRRAIKVYGIEREVGQAFRYQSDRARDRAIRLNWTQCLAMGRVEAVQYAGIGLIYAAGAYFCLYRTLEVGTFFAFVTSVSLLLGALTTFLNLGIVNANARSALEKLDGTLKVGQSTPELDCAERVDFAAQQQKAEAAGLPFVQFQNVSFGYDSVVRSGDSADDAVIFDDLSITIDRGQSVALVGPSGSGKSTFTAMLLRMYDPRAGQIFVNGVPIKCYGLSDLRSGFGVVPQDPFLFKGTIWDNLIVTNPKASPHDVRRAMDLALVSEFVDRLPDGLATVLGEGGAGLSGGQRQRLAIARAILADSQCYVFDEATSALDVQSERLIQSAIERLLPGRTSFVIAHRLSTIRKCDRVLVFDKGRVVQDGSYAKLAHTPGLFQDMLRQADGGDFIEAAA
jgi:ATP-binding cassette, subfamily B, bacterial